AIAESKRLRDLDAGLRDLRVFDRLAQHRHEPGLARPVRPQHTIRSSLQMNCLPVLNSNLPSGAATAASSSVIRTLACVPRLASLIVPAERSRCAGFAASSSFSARCFNCLVFTNRRSLPELMPILLSLAAC